MQKKKKIKVYTATMLDLLNNLSKIFQAAQHNLSNFIMMFEHVYMVFSIRKMQHADYSPTDKIARKNREFTVLLLYSLG